MNILHVTPYYAPAWAYGGVVRAVYGLATAQATLGHSVTVLTTDTASPTQRLAVSREIIDSVAVIRCHNMVGPLRRLNLSSPFGVRRALSQLPATPDIIHCHELRTVENLLVTASRRAAHVPLVVSLHGTLPQTTGRVLVKQTWDRLFGKALAGRFSGVTDPMADDYLDDDANVSAMRDTADKIGLQNLIVEAYELTDDEDVEAKLLKALLLLGVSFAAEEQQ